MGEAAEPSAVDLAMQGLAAMIAAGPPPDRVIAAIGTLVAGWADEADMSDDVMLNRVERLWDGFSSDAAALQEQLSDAEGAGPELARGERVLAALNAAVSTLAAISAR